MNRRPVRSREYWASVDVESIGKEVKSQWDKYVTWFKSSGYATRQRLCYNRMYGLDNNGSLELNTRPDGSLVDINTNQFRSLVQGQHSFVVTGKASFLARAVNSDVASQKDCFLANGYLDYINESKQLDEKLSDTAEYALTLSQYWLHCPWDFGRGREMAADESGATYRSGEQAFELFSDFNVARDPSQRADDSWVIVRRRVNKWNLAVEFPEFAESLQSATTESNPDEELNPRVLYGSDFGGFDDLCDVFVLYHAVSSVLPEGRETWVCNGEVILNGPLRYQDIPVYRMSAARMMDTNGSYGDSFDILPLTEGITALTSAALTNSITGAVHNFWVQSGEDGASMQLEALGQGGQILSGPHKPEVLELSGSSDSALKMIDVLMNHAQLITSVNSVVRGAPEASLKSGAALALVNTQAYQFMADVQRNFTTFCGRVATCIVTNAQRFASDTLLAAVGGVGKRSSIKEFTAKDIARVVRVTCQPAAPQLQSAAGKQELAAAMVQAGTIQPGSPQYMQVLLTGSVDAVSEASFNHSLYIRSENEQLLNGQLPRALITDNHVEHIMEHRGVLDDPSARQNPDILANFDAHLKEHLDLMRNMPPDLAALFGTPALPSAQQQPAAPQGGPQGAPQGPGQINGQRLPSLPPGAPAPVQDNYSQINQPNFGNNPPQG